MRADKLHRACIECGNPTKGRRWRCNACWLDRRRERGLVCMRRYRAANPERVKESLRRYRTSPRGIEKRIKGDRKYRQRHPDQCHARKAKWYAANKARLNAESAERYRRRSRAADGAVYRSHKQALARQLYARQRKEFLKANPLWGYGNPKGCWRDEYRRQQNAARVAA